MLPDLGTSSPTRRQGLGPQRGKDRKSGLLIALTACRIARDDPEIAKPLPDMGYRLRHRQSPIHSGFSDVPAGCSSQILSTAIGKEGCLTSCLDDAARPPPY